MWSSVMRPPRGGGSHASNAVAAAPTKIALVDCFSTQATSAATAMTAIRIAAFVVGQTETEAAGTRADREATPSIAMSKGCAASATNCAALGTGASNTPRKSIGCTAATNGPATRLLTGAMRLTRP